MLLVSIEDELRARFGQIAFALLVANALITDPKAFQKGDPKVIKGAVGNCRADLLHQSEHKVYIVNGAEAQRTDFTGFVKVA